MGFCAAAVAKIRGGADGRAASSCAALPLVPSSPAALACICGTAGAEALEGLLFISARAAPDTLAAPIDGLLPSATHASGEISLGIITAACKADKRPVSASKPPKGEECRGCVDDRDPESL